MEFKIQFTPNWLLFGHKNFERLELDKVLEFSFKWGINEAVEGLEDNDDSYSIYSVSSSEGSFVHSQPEPDWNTAAYMDG